MSKQSKKCLVNEVRKVVLSLGKKNCFLSSCVMSLPALKLSYSLEQ